LGGGSSDSDNDGSGSANGKDARGGEPADERRGEEESVVLDERNRLAVKAKTREHLTKRTSRTKGDGRQAYKYSVKGGVRASASDWLSAPDSCSQTSFP
jgi:hypothetical protein